MGSESILPNSALIQRDRLSDNLSTYPQSLDDHQFIWLLLYPTRRTFLKTTRYFEEQVLVKRPYLKREWCQQAIQPPLRREIQLNGRIRYWIYISELGKYLRFVTLR